MRINYKAILLMLLGLAGLTVYRYFTAEEYLLVSNNRDGSGICYAISKNGLEWCILNNGNPVFKAPDYLDRIVDPFVVGSDNGAFHLIFTYDDVPHTLGYAYSHDLVHWEQGKQFVLPGADSAEVVVSPKMIFDQSTNEWLVYWSSVPVKEAIIMGKAYEKGKRHRIFAAKTVDFIKFSEPFLFFDPGYSVTDANIVETMNGFFLVFKDESQSPAISHLVLASSESLYGSWEIADTVLSGNLSSGVYALERKDGFGIYYNLPDKPRQIEFVSGNIGSVWKNKNKPIFLPDGCKPGSFLKLSRKEARYIKEKLATDIHIVE